MELQVGDILLKKGTAIGAVLIREFTADGAPYEDSYSHCGIYAGEGKVYDARYPHVGLFDLDYPDYDVCRVPLSPEQTTAILAYCESKKGTHYALEGLVDEGIERLLHIPIGIKLNHELWCSLLVNYAFAKAGILLTRKPYPVPNDIAWSVVTSKVS